MNLALASRRPWPVLTRLQLPIKKISHFQHFGSWTIGLCLFRRSPASHRCSLKRCVSFTTLSLFRNASSSLPWLQTPFTYILWVRTKGFWKLRSILYPFFCLAELDCLRRAALSYEVLFAVLMGAKNQSTLPVIQWSNLPLQKIAQVLANRRELFSSFGNCLILTHLSVGWLLF